MHKHKRFLATAFACALLFFAHAALPASSDQEMLRQTLAPTGQLRIGVYPGSPTSLLENVPPEEARGVTVEVGRELARQLGVPFELVIFQRSAEVSEGLRTGKADVTITNATPARAEFLDFTPVVLEVEQGYMAGAGSPITAMDEVDRPGVRLGVTQGATSAIYLMQTLQHADITEVPNIETAIGMMARDELDVYATNKGVLYQMSDSLPGARILDGRWGEEHFAIGIPMGRKAAWPWLLQFAEEVSTEGLVAAAAERAGLRGVLPAAAP